MKLAIILGLLLSVYSCGKKDEKSKCTSRADEVLRCRTEMQPNYGYQYAIEKCEREYNSHRCWEY